jgi:DNA-binding response OmpR family regulator
MQPTIVVFVVEDERLIHMALEEALIEGGYSVEIASAGEEATEKLEAPDAHFGALVTDVNLGSKLSGWDVARRARELFPLLPVVYMTGADAAEWGVNGVPNSILVHKPFAPAQVVTAVSQLLNQTATPSPGANG